MSAQRGFRFTSESVFEGHPDKVADGISDALLDATLARDPNARVATEAQWRMFAEKLRQIANEA